MFMRGKKSSQDPSKSASGMRTAPALPSIISENLKILGDIVCDGDVQIEGVVEGDVRTKTLIVGESALVKGSIHCEIARIRGTVDGEIVARTVFLARTARVRGDILHEQIAIEAGAYLDGRCRRLEEEQLAVAQLTSPGTAGLLPGAESRRERGAA